MEPVSILPPLAEDVPGDTLPSIIPPNNVVPTEETAGLRAYKAHFGLGELSPGYDVLRGQISTGLESDARRNAVVLYEADATRKRLQLINEAARRKGGPIDPATADFINTMAQQGVRDPLSVFEEGYASKFIDTARATNPEALLLQAQAEADNPEAARRDVAISKEAIAYREFSFTLFEKAKQASETQSLGGLLVDISKFVIPGYYDYKMRALGAVTPFFSPLLAGSNIEEAVSNLYRLPFEQFKIVSTAVMDGLIKDNPSLAVQFAGALVGRPTSSTELDNILPVLDYITMGQAAKGVANLFRNKQALKGIVKSVEGPGVTPEVTQLAAGNVENAAVSKVAGQMLKGVPTSEDLVTPLLSNLRTDVTELGKSPWSLGREFLTRLEEKMMANIGRFGEMISDPTNVNRFTKNAIEMELKAMGREFAEDYPRLSGTVIDVREVKNPIANVYDAKILLGGFDGKPFEHEWIAQHARVAYDIPHSPAVKIEQEGNNWFITVTKPLRETDDAFRNGMIKTGYTETPRSWINHWIGFLRTPDDTMSTFNTEMRKTLAYAPNGFSVFIKDVAKEITALKPFLRGKKQWNEFMQFLEIGANKVDPANGQQGYFFKSVGEIESTYLSVFGRKPSEQEVRGYFAFKQIVEFDRVFRDVAVYRNKHRVGAEQIKIGDTTFDGIIRKDLPKDVDANVLDVKSGKVYALDRVPPEVRQRWDDLIKTGGLRVTQVYEAGSKPLRELAQSSEYVHFVLSDRIETKPLGWATQVPRRGGGHIEYEYQNVIAQARVRLSNLGDGAKQKFRAYYEGDAIIMPISVRALGTKVVQKLDDVRLLLKEGKDLEAAAYVRANLPIPEAKVLGWFKPRVVNGVPDHAFLSLDQPIVVKASGTRTIDVDKTLQERYGAAFKDRTKDPFDPSRQMDVQFTGERDDRLFTINEKGTSSNPLWAWEQAKVIDPLPMMYRSTQRIIQSRFLDDYKIGSIEHWIGEFSKVLKVSTSELRANPLWHFYHPEFLAGADALDKAAAQTAHRNIMNLLRTPSELSTKVHAMNQKLADMIYEKAGQRGSELAQKWLLPHTSDPWKYARSVAFDLKLGMFNWVQMLVQMNTIVHSVAIAGTHNGISGTLGATMTAFTRMTNNPKIIAHFDQLISNIKLPGVARWKPGEFTESVSEMRKSGFGIIAGEHSFVDDVTDVGVWNSKSGQFLEAGRWFFKEGERANRYTGWHIAYKEWRAKNPFGKIDDPARAEILNRADLLTANMSRASSSAMHTGVMSVPLQFLSYQLRIAEQLMPFWSTRLTTAEKARAYMTYGILYGFPTAISASGIPAADSIRQYALEKGINISDGYMKTVMDGVVSHALQMMTGTSYDVAGRFGLQGMTVVRDLLNSDKKWWELATGASGSVIGNIIAQSSGFRRAMMSMFQDGGESFPPKGEDFLDTLREASSLGRGYQGWMAWNTGKWFSRRDIMLEKDITPTMAAIMTATGMNTTRISDMHLYSLNVKSLKADQEALGKEITLNMQRGYRASSDRNYEQAKQYFTRAETLFKQSGLQPHQRADLISKSSRGYEAMVDTIEWQHLQAVGAADYPGVYEQVSKLRTQRKAKAP